MIALIPLLLLTFGAHATSFMNQPFPEAVQDAPVIARGKVGMSYSDWVQLKSGVKRIHTFTELRVEEVLKGRIGSASIMMRELGGEKDGKGMQVAGTARFTRGDDVVVFLSPTDDSSTFQVKGMMMGKLDVERSADGEEYLSGPAISGADEHGHSRAEADEEGTGRWTLTRLRDLVRTQEESPSADAAISASTTSPVAVTTPVATSEETTSPSVDATEPAPRLQSTDSDSPGAARRWWLILAFVLAPFIAWIIRKKSKR